MAPGRYRGRDWTPEELGQLRRTPYGGRKELARRLGRTMHAVHSAARRHGMAGYKSRRLPEAEVRRMNGAGMCDAEIGRQLGVSRYVAECARKRLGLPANRGRSSLWSWEQRLGKVFDACEARGWPAAQSLAECDILDALKARGPLTLTGLSEALGVRYYNLGANGKYGRAMRRLCSGGLVQAQRLPPGRRGGQPRLYRLPVPPEKRGRPLIEILD